MDEVEFVKNAIRTESIVSARSRLVNKALVVNIMSLFIAAGNMLDIVKKSYFYNKKHTPEELHNLNSECISATEIINRSVSNLLEGIELDLTDKTDILKGNDVLTSISTRLMHGMVGIATEGVELIENLKSNIVSDYNSEKNDIVNIKEELGDIEWYKAIIYDVMYNEGIIGFNDSDIRTMVINKLKERYGNKFTEDAANNRDLSAERAILESPLNNSEIPLEERDLEVPK